METYSLSSYLLQKEFQGTHIRVNILKGNFFTDLKFHSFANGLIFGKNDEGEYKVCVSGGYLLIKEIEIDGKICQQSKIFKLGKYLK